MIQQPDADPAVRRRPKDRKVQIARASADAFGSQGYHAVSMGDIAARVGITPAALYRHSPSKYDLFRDAALGLTQLLVDATAFADDLGGDADPATTLGALVSALVDTTITHRTAGGLYRWQARHLRGPDRTTLMDQVELVNHRLQRPLAQLRPGLTASQRWTLATATLSVIGSITTHSNVLAVGEIRTCMAAIASDILAADLPTARRSAGDRRAPLSVGAIAGTYEHVLYEAVRLFYGRGYRNTSMEDIATAVGIQASGLYRTFPRKAAILALAYRRAADRHSGDLTDVLSRIQDPETALTELIDAYLTRVMESPEQAYVYYTERHNLSESDLRVLDAIEHSMVDAWARLVTAARPEMRIGCARYAVCAAFVLAVDFNRLVDDYSGSESIATIRRLMEVTMLGRPAARGPRRGRR